MKGYLPFFPALLKISIWALDKLVCTFSTPAALDAEIFSQFQRIGSKFAFLNNTIFFS